MSDQDTFSFIPEKFSKDQEVIDSINELYNCPAGGNTCIKDAILKIVEQLKNIDKFDTDGIYVTAGTPVSNLSQIAFGSWRTIQDGMSKKFDEDNSGTKVKDVEKYEEKKRKYFKQFKSFSIKELQKYVETSESITDCILIKAEELSINMRLQA